MSLAAFEQHSDSLAKNAADYTYLADLDISVRELVGRVAVALGSGDGECSGGRGALGSRFTEAAFELQQQQQQQSELLQQKQQQKLQQQQLEEQRQHEQRQQQQQQWQQQQQQQQDCLMLQQRQHEALRQQQLQQQQGCGLHGNAEVRDC